MEDICSYALEIGKKRSDYVEVKAERSFSNEVVLKNGKPETSGFDMSYGLSVRAVVDGALGFSSTNNLERGNVMMVVEGACRMAKAASKLIKNPLRFSEEERHSNVNYQVRGKEKAVDVSPEEKLSLLKEVNGSFAGDVRLAGNLMNLSDDVTEKYYINSEGSSIHSIIPKVSFFGFFTVVENGDSAQAMLEKGASKGWEAVAEWELGDYVSEEISVLRNVLSKGKSPPKGKMDVLCGPEVTGIASHESCGHPYEADRILGREAAQAGESFVSLDMLGTRIGSDLVNLVDDPTIGGSYGYYLYDDEGVKARKRHLIKGGIINELLHNRETAGHLGLKSNGSARCNSYDREPIIRMANTYVEAGEWNRDEIIGDTKKGVLINSFTEWNIDDRRYNQKYVSREAYLIEDGEIRHPLKKVSLELTTPRFWSSVDAVGDDVRFFAGNCGKGEPIQGIPVFMGGPTMRLHDIDMGGSV